ncbi:LamG domain-containing protein [Paenibacillus nasutitermitis]|uniref:LamG domain-containing protein n=1 Tax=Paenibacillus nasutitermitis TaxID=1652958 RepID=A0A916ZFU3_9BACL|nr:LamG domain-containing protein [Paenibacillus nasutitermitis]GGD95001.1 hypothetical protein GCM10010911_62080 [Paenibacillus nasutitermitis]
MNKLTASDSFIKTEGLISLWDFQNKEGDTFIAKGPYPYKLKEMNGAVDVIEAPIAGGKAIDLSDSKWLSIAREECPMLNIYGADARFSVMAWVKRTERSSSGCEFVAGIWNETKKRRQYGLFINLEIWDSSEQACGHVSAVGGPTPGYKYCMTSAIGTTPVAKGEWHFIVFTYNGSESTIYLDGVLDYREGYNPYPYPDGIFDGGKDGADFTVGAVNRSDEIGNFYHGLLGGLAVYNRALSENEIAELYSKSID